MRRDYTGPDIGRPLGGDEETEVVHVGSGGEREAWGLLGCMRVDK